MVGNVCGEGGAHSWAARQGSLRSGGRGQQDRGGGGVEGEPVVMGKCAFQHLPERSPRQDHLADEFTEAQQGELTCSWAWARKLCGGAGGDGQGRSRPQHATLLDTGSGHSPSLCQVHPLWLNLEQGQCWSHYSAGRRGWAPIQGSPRVTEWSP